MLIAIPSKARSTRQVTLSNLPKSIRDNVHLVVGAEEGHSYDLCDQPTILCAPGIGHARQAAVDYCVKMGENKLFMLDDDLTFALRRTDKPELFTTPTDFDIVNCFEEVQNLLDDSHHVAIAPREGGNRRTDNFVYNNRALRALAYRVDTLQKEGIRFDDAELMEDFTVQLRLLLKGYPHCSINWMVQNQGGSNTTGGCSTYRTMESQAKAAHALKERFPDFVTLTQKKTKTAWGGQERTDVIIQWKKAYEWGRAHAGKS